MPHGKLIVLSAPSGSGKTTIAKAILQHYPEMKFSVSATTRPRRLNETEGRDYFFLTRAEFESRIVHGGLVEHEEIYGNLYGSLKSEVDKVIAGGGSMLFDIDVKGALSIKRMYHNDAVLIFVQAPSVEIIEERLSRRKTEDTETVKRRMERVPMELEFGKQFDFRVINDNLEQAIDDVKQIVERFLLSN
jgi:guanylate kinase